MTKPIVHMATATGPQELNHGTTGSATQLKDLEIIHRHRLIDLAWQKYLRLLDEYITAQAALREHMTAGFLSLAQANFKSSGRRYGQDYYDQRGVATTRVKFQINSADEDCPELKIVKVDRPESKAGAAETTEDDLHDKLSKATLDEALEISEAAEQTSLDAECHMEEKASKEAGSQNPPDVKEESTKPLLNPHDPIRWFGILVPPPLRAAQTSFTSAVLGNDGDGSGDCIAKAVRAAREMRTIEAGIRRLRKELRKLERRGMLDTGPPPAPPPHDAQEIEGSGKSVEEDG